MVKFDFVKTPITQIADYIILAAAKSKASDIHFDPREDGLMVRFRVDGDLQDYTLIPNSYERNLSTRLKLLANMNITETRLPQDGAIKGKIGDMYLDMRVSSLPMNKGEKIVIRILDYSRSLEGLDKLGFNEENLKKLKRMIRVPNGMILITGATGSGKSTTVYSVLQTLNKEETNIITVEDPIEMNIEGLNQVQVNADIGMTFANALRSILRQDPNIILIGEIRDSETAQIAVRSSITGHLVLSTVHTNNALATIERLLDMDVERYLLSTALTGVISQRLAKKICPKCGVVRKTTDYEKKLFKEYLKRDVEEIHDANKDGCDECRNGYKGRIAIQEVLEFDDEIRGALTNENIQKEELRKLVYTDKVITMLQDALGKVVDGITSIDEVYRIIEIDDSDSLFSKDTKTTDETVNNTDTNGQQTNSVVNIVDNIDKNEVNNTIANESISYEPVSITESTNTNESINSTEVAANNSQIVVPTFTNNDTVSNNSINTIPVTPITTGADRVQTGILNQPTTNIPTQNTGVVPMQNTGVISVQPIQLPTANTIPNNTNDTQ